MTKMIANGDVELATEAFGDPADPPVLLIMGAMASMLWWPEDFCQALAARGRFVIRYDNRDVGLSTKFAHVEPEFGRLIAALRAGEEPDVPYFLSEMAADGMAVFGPKSRIAVLFFGPLV